jgi:hypothetical protein
MTIASGQNQILTFDTEGTYGTADTGSGFSVFEHKSNSLSLAKTTYEDEKLRGDREVEGMMHGQHSVSGDIAFDLGYQASHIEFIKAAMGDFTGSSDVFSIGTARRSYTIVRKFTDITVKDEQVFKGIEVNAFNMNISSDGLIDCSVGLIGTTMTHVDNHDEGSVTTETVANAPYTSHEAVITEGGGAQTIITDLSMSLDNGMSPVYRVGTDIPVRGGQGKCRVTGSLTAHFDSGALLDKFVAETATSLKIVLGTGDTDMSFEMPNVIYTTGAVEVGGEGLLSVSMDYTALVSTDGTSALKFDTTP